VFVSEDFNRRMIQFSKPGDYENVLASRIGGPSHRQHSKGLRGWLVITHAPHDQYATITGNHQVVDK
jgi:hypothetical protein